MTDHKTLEIPKFDYRESHTSKGSTPRLPITCLEVIDISYCGDQNSFRYRKEDANVISVAAATVSTKFYIFGNAGKLIEWHYPVKEGSDV